MLYNEKGGKKNIDSREISASNRWGISHLSLLMTLPTPHRSAGVDNKENSYTVYVSPSY
jgi:hypothetical protein